MKLEMLSKKAIAGLVAGTFIMVGAATPFIVHAADLGKGNPGISQCHHKQATPEQIAAHMSEMTGLSPDTILKYHATGMDFRDIGRAAFLAAASSKTMDEVISHKTTDKNWKDVANELGITKEQMKATHQNMIANSLNVKLGVDKDVTLNLLSQGYHPRDIGMAAQLSTSTSKSIDEVLSLKKINNTWRDVATTLGVDPTTIKHDMMGHGFGFDRGHRDDK